MDFDNTSRTELSELGEFGLISHLTQHIELQHDSTIKGVGDDAAIIHYENAVTVASSDMLVEGVHFDLSYVPLRHLGYKSVVVNLSDIYAMNAEPQQILVSIAISNRFGLEFQCGFFGALAGGRSEVAGKEPQRTSNRVVLRPPHDQFWHGESSPDNQLVCRTGDGSQSA